MAPFLIPGTYDVAVELAGFRKYAHRGVVLQVNQRARVDATLELGGLTEATEVIGLAPLTRTDSAELGEVIEERAVRELPLNGRNFATLVYLAPGVTAGQVGENLSGASTFNPRGASNFNALGSQANTNAWLVDGIDNNEYTFNTVIVQPTVESVREFKVLTGHLLGRVRARRGRRLRLDQVRAATSGTARPSSTCATRSSTPRTSSRCRRRPRPRSTATSSAPRSRARSSRTRPSSSSTTRASRRSAARCS